MFVFLVAIVALIAPWTFRNWLVLGDFVPVATEGGVTFLLGYSDGVLLPGDQAPEDFASQVWKEAQGSEVAASHLAYRQALDWIRTHPFQAFAGWIRRALLFWSPLIEGNAVLQISVAFIFAAGVPGLIILSRRQFILAGILLVPVLSSWLVNIVFRVFGRFRLPAYPSLIACSAVTLGELWRWLGEETSG
jgi:hypothetical protein